MFQPRAAVCRQDFIDVLILSRGFIKQQEVTSAQNKTLCASNCSMGDGGGNIWVPLTIVGSVLILILVVWCACCNSNNHFESRPRRGRPTGLPTGIPWVETITTGTFPTRPEPVYWEARGGRGGMNWFDAEPGYYPGVNIIEREPIFGRR
jgi:hypothetical protein